jgi:hypothetical protein
VAQGANDLVVSNGLFTHSLNFPPANFGGDAVYMQIEVRPGASAGAYTVLTPRQTISPTPYAIYALNVPWTESGNDIFSSNSGNVGIGTTNPLTKLHIGGGAESSTLASGTLFIQSAGGMFGQIMTMDGNEINGWSQLHLNPDADTNVFMVAGGGNVGIASASPATRLHIEGGSDTEPGSGGFLTIGTITSTNLSMDNNEIMARNNGVAATLALNADGGNISMIQGGTGGVTIGTTSLPAGVKLNVNGTARVNVLEIMGADLAEKFPVSNSDALTPGTVVMIDAKHAGKLCLAEGAYNKRVAGVVSGANGLSAGTILGHLPGTEDAPAIALSGRVWVRCEATQAAIEIGDLLTTSDTPGHAMVASDASRSHGAVIGKAMTALPQGETGMVLVLVNLQ